MKHLLKSVFIVSLAVFFFSCKAVDLRTDALLNKTIENPEQQGRTLLTAAKKAMGYDLLEQTEVYETKAIFDWNPVWLTMPMNAFPGNNKKELRLRLATNSFDGQVEYFEGRKKGTIQGVQSWEGYKTNTKGDKLKRHEHDRYIWGLATYHYLLEAPMHLPNAEIVRYAGKKPLDGIDYDVVFVSWGSEAPNKTYDRMLAYVNPKTRFIDVLEVTINDFFITMPKGLQHATARYKREKTSIGTYLPSKVTIQFKAPKKPESAVYDFSLSDYRFDSFNKEKLYPIQGLKNYGFSKPTK